jgi:hypothetical protein
MMENEIKKNWKSCLSLISIIVIFISCQTLLNHMFVFFTVRVCFVLSQRHIIKLWKYQPFELVNVQLENFIIDGKTFENLWVVPLK